MEGIHIPSPIVAGLPRFVPGEEVLFDLARAEFWQESHTPRRKPRWGIGRILGWRMEAEAVVYTLSVRFATRPLLCRVPELDIEGVA
ncbi:MAG: hypothetical protein HY873_09965 [Chloroflexi bacterium]|nr:hypothetical protein [Chloroflexota bacterium]